MTAIEADVVRFLPAIRDEMLPPPEGVGCGPKFGITALHRGQDPDASTAIEDALSPPVKAGLTARRSLPVTSRRICPASGTLSASTPAAYTASPATCTTSSERSAPSSERPSACVERVPDPVARRRPARPPSPASARSPRAWRGPRCRRGRGAGPTSGGRSSPPCPPPCRAPRRRCRAACRAGAPRARSGRGWCRASEVVIQVRWRLKNVRE